jgi:hypothetical protein
VETVRIQLQASPANASLTIDGAPISNPFDQVVEKSGKHRIRAEAPGYRETEFTLNFDRHRDLSLRLQKLRVPRKPAARRHAPARASAPAREATRSSAQPVPAPAQSKPAAKPAAKGAGFVSESPY